MPSVAQEEPILTSSKKRRRSDDDSGAPILLQFSHPHFHGSPFNGTSPRKILPLSKRSRLDEDAFRDSDPHQPIHNHTYRSHPSSPSRHARPPTISRSPSSSIIPTPTSDALQTTTANNSRPAKPLTARLSAPCHICHRRPTKKSIEQDDFGDCQACGERACFICIRQCAGWRDNGASWVDEQGRAHEHKQIVCSRCCVERGVDGEPVCLGCLPFVEG